MREYEKYWLKKGTELNGKYEILDVIDEGGSGIVYLGFDKILQQQVSIKEYFPRCYAMRMNGEKEIAVYKGNSRELYRQGLSKFVNEARTLAHFEGLDSIVMVKDFFYQNQTAYMVMERILGENVKQIVERDGPMSPQKVFSIMKPILYSMNEIHKEGLLHRDISPDNIILTKSNKAVLIDFGAARFSEMRDNKTMTVFFKRGYSAEEQYVENSEKGAYTDVYGASATIYFMLTGIRPDESVRRLIRDQVVPLWKFKDIDMERYKKQAIMKGMAVDAKKRYSSMQELCVVLYQKKKIFSRWIKFCSVLGLILCGVIVSLINYKTLEKGGMVSIPAEVVATASPKVSEVPVPKTYQMCNVVGMKRKAAVKKLHALNAKLEVKIQWKNSSKKNKGHIISQKIKGGKTLYENKQYTQIIVVGKGIKPTATVKPQQTRKPAEFDGTLPW